MKTRVAMLTTAELDAIRAQLTEQLNDLREHFDWMASVQKASFAKMQEQKDHIDTLEAELRDRTAELHAEQSVMGDTLDMVCAPQCGDPFLPERITRVQMLADQRDKVENALQFYADLSAWLPTPGLFDGTGASRANADRGERARDALKGGD